MSVIYLVDDDPSMSILCENLQYRNHKVIHTQSLDQAFSEIDIIFESDLIILDIIIPLPREISHDDIIDSSAGGMKLLLEIKKRKEEFPILIYSATQNKSIHRAVDIYPNTFFISKWENQSLEDFMRKITRILLQNNNPLPLISFIVHGNDENEKLKLKDFLQNTLYLPEPIILNEKANKGLTFFEKLEQHLMYVDVAFVLLTPDDKCASSSDNEDLKFRARQNVILEMGYLLGLLGRRSGRVLLLYKGELDIPSDILGLTYIDISNGIESVGELIRKEIETLEYE